MAELDWDEGPFYQMKRLERYREVGEQLLAKDLAYWDYCSKEELEAMREAQLARGEKPRYDRRWRRFEARRRPRASRRCCASRTRSRATLRGTTW